MPRRMIDFEALWASDKIGACAEWAQAEYAWLYGLADAHGNFELTNLRVIWGKVAAIRKNLSLELLERVIEEFHNHGLLLIWEDGGKRYGHWTGSDRPGRLPPRSQRDRYEKLAPPTPKDRLDAYLLRFSRRAVEPQPEEAPPFQVGEHPDEIRSRPGEPQDRVEEGEGNTGIGLGRHSPAMAGAGATSHNSWSAGPPTEDGEVTRFPHGGESGEKNPNQLHPRVLLEVYARERGPLPAVRVETPERLSKCRTRLLRHAEDQQRFLADFTAAVRKASQIRWPAWRPSFDWLVANDSNYVKVIEGHYDNWAEPSGGGNARHGRNLKGSSSVTPPRGKYESRKPDFEYTN